IRNKGFDPVDQLERYVRWWREGYMSANGHCFDIGNTTVQALSNFVHTRRPDSGSTDENAAGNGSIMRLAPVPLAWAHDLGRAVELSGESSRTTHGAHACISA